jgi:hypothetical protein
MMALDRRISYFLLLALLAWPTLAPWGLPLNVGPEARDFHAAVDAVPAGGRIVLSVEHRADFGPELNPMTAAVFARAMERNVRVIVWAGVDEGAMIAQGICEPIAKQLGKQYGVDWINLGYKPISDVLLQTMVDDFWSAVAHTEIGGRHLREFPIMAEFRSIGQADLLVVIVGVVPGPQRYVAMVTVPTGIPMVTGVTGVEIAAQMPFYRGGQYEGILGGLRGAAEYEYLVGRPGRAIAGMDSQSAAHMLIFVLIILGNLGYIVSMRLQKKGPNKGVRV